MRRTNEQFDELLRDMARQEDTPLPPGLDQRLEQVYARLDFEGQTVKKEEKPVKRKIFTLARVAAIAAVIALCVASMAVGALAFSTERIVEKEVPVGPEIVEMGDSGLSIILPSSWRGKYVAVADDENCFIYEKSIYDACMALGEEAGMAYPSYSDPDKLFPVMGRVFWVDLYPEQVTAEEYYAEASAPAQYLMCTEQGALIRHFNSDVQYPESADEFPGYTQEQVDAMREAYFSLTGNIQFAYQGVTIGPVDNVTEPAGT